MNVVPSNAVEMAPHQLGNFLTLKAKVIHTDELIRRYREKSQECVHLQEQLREAVSCETSLQQSMVGLRAEMQALVEENTGLCRALTSSQCEKDTLQAMATNAEMVVEQLSARVETEYRAVATIRQERDRFSEQCSQLKDQLKKALQWPLGVRSRRRSFSTFSLPTSPPLSTGSPSLTVSSLPGDVTYQSHALTSLRDEEFTNNTLEDNTHTEQRSKVTQEVGPVDLLVSEVTQEAGPIDSSESEVTQEAGPVDALVSEVNANSSSEVDVDLSVSDCSSVTSDNEAVEENSDILERMTPPQDHHSPTLSPLPSPLPSHLSPLPSPLPSHLPPLPSPLPSPHPSHLSPLPSPLPSHLSPLPSPLVHAAADTMNSDSDSDISLSEVESLSPIPPSPHPRLPTLSPLPLSPAGQTLSPLPHSPPPTLPEFVTAAPEAPTLRVPVPSVCVTSSPPPIVSPSHPHQSILHRSHCSPFSSTSLSHAMTSPLSLPQPLAPRLLSPPSRSSHSHATRSPTSQAHTIPSTSRTTSSQPPELEAGDISESEASSTAMERQLHVVGDKELAGEVDVALRGYTEEVQSLRDTVSTQEMRDTGSTQEMGDTGSTQEMGDTGSTQEMGDTGSTQEMGDTGITQEMRDTGSMQETRDTGSTQEMGDTGSTRDTGSTQEMGDTGSMQETRDTESTQETGDTGSTQETGDTGSTQEMGDTGSTQEMGDTVSTQETRDTGSTQETRDAGSTSDTGTSKDTVDTLQSWKSTELSSAMEKGELEEGEIASGEEDVGDWKEDLVRECVSDKGKETPAVDQTLNKNKRVTRHTSCSGSAHRFSTPITTRHRALDILRGCISETPARGGLCSTAASQLPGYRPVKSHAARKRRMTTTGVMPQPKISKLGISSLPPSSGQSKRSKTFSESCTSEDRRLQNVMTSGESSTATGPSAAVEAHSSQSEQPTVCVSSFTSSQQPKGVGYSNQHHNTPQATLEVEYSTQTPDIQHVRQTDRATGQVEELTPLSSPVSLGEILAEPPASCPPRGPAQQTTTHGLSMLQQSLCVELQCPLPLPEWLVAGMVRIQTMTGHTPRPLLRKKRAVLNARRQPNQKPRTYAQTAIERMVTGQMTLSAAVAMFADSWNCPNVTAICHALPMYLQSSYLPRIEHVMSTYNSLCNDTKTNPLLCPYSPSFPPALLRPECQLVALLYHTAKLNSSMPSLLTDVATALYSAALSPLVTFHRLAAITRIFTAVCRLLGEKERVLFLCCDLLRRPLASCELPVLTGMVGVWPVPLARRPDVAVVVGGRLSPGGVEAQPLSYGLEVVVTVMMRQAGLSLHHISKLNTLGQWSNGQTIDMRTVDKLASVLLQILQTSPRVTVEHLPCQGWCRPKPSHLTFHLVHTLRLVSWFKGWVWTSDVLIKAHIWPILQAWNSKSDSVAVATVMAVVRLLGFIGQQGTESGAASLAKLQKLLLSLLLRPDTPLSIQLCAAESLIELCPPSLSSSRDAVAVLWQWLRGLADHPAGSHLSREFCPKLSTAPPTLKYPPINTHPPSTNHYLACLVPSSMTTHPLSGPVPLQALHQVPTSTI